MRLFFITLIFFLFNQSIVAQRKDCTSSLNIESKILLNIIIGNGFGIEEIQGQVCGNDLPDVQEIQSYWITWTAYTPGTFTFDISPDDPSANIDFIVYKLEDGCNQKTPIRCMLSSYDNNSTGICAGDTGLSINSTDDVELIGCQGNDDNYLRALELEANESYALVINNVSQTLQSIDVTFCGEALLGPQDFICSLTTNTNTSSITSPSVQLFPNPVADKLFLKSELAINSISIYRLSGERLATFNDYQGPLDLSSLGLVTGLYLVTIETEEGRIIEKISYGKD